MPGTGHRVEHRTLAAPASLLGRRGGWGEPLLDAATEQELAWRIEAGLLAREALEEGTAPPGATADELQCLVTEGEQAWERFHASNLGLVVKLVRDIDGRLDDDLLQQGLEALGAAIRVFDARRGLRFSTLAHRYVQHAVAVARRRRDTLLATPDGRLRNLALVAAQRAELAELGQAETVGAVAARLGRPESWVAAHWTREQRVAPDVSEVEGAGVRLVRDDPGRDPLAEAAASTGAGAALGCPGPMWWLAHLPADEARLLRLRFGLDGRPPLTCARIAAHDGVPVVRLRQQERRALAHVRGLLLHGEYEGGGLDARMPGGGLLAA